ncbi:MAG TPA: DUF3995 domain-containing protein [Xanthobacteraceae bacterium]|nr:DUF3995 domain-containing protein [Xanthobacteraceae bacterium]
MTSIAVAMFFMLTGIAVLHILWALGSRWPARNERELVAQVIGRKGMRQMPPPLQCALAGFAIFLAGVVALIVSGFLIVPLPSMAITLLGFVAAAIFGLRGLAAWHPAWRDAFSQEPFATMDRTKFGPLCLLFAVCFFALSMRRLGYF